jgi:predicted component of type VI protein secretion system
LLQEIDLAYGETVLGRSADANLTIEDPLVSRLHARITIDETGARVEDLGSRNGVRVNGTLIRTPTRLNDGDRLRLGTQDLIFCKVERTSPRHTRTTGVLRLCANCRLPYPREMVACPNCEATEQMEEQTLQGDEPIQEKGGWGTQLLVEALERALAHGRKEDAERIVRRATAELEAHHAAGGAIDSKTLAGLATHASATTLATGDPAWAAWTMDIYRRTNRVPTPGVVRAWGEALTKHAVALQAPLGRLVEQLRGKGGAAPGQAGQPANAEGEALGRLEDLALLVERRLGTEATADPDATLDVAGQWSKLP